jgi:hypothetical protein
MCWDDEFTLLHEIAHIWLVNTLEPDRRVQFIEMRHDVASWVGDDVAWHERGVEHAANVIAWGLLEDPYPVSDTYPNDVASMIEAFVFLTDVAPLHDGGPGIQLPDRTLYEGRSNPPLESGR